MWVWLTPRLVFPAKGLGDLFGEGEGVEGLEEDTGQAKTGETALVYALDLGGEQKDRDICDGGVLLHGAEGGGTVDSGHHDVHENGIGPFDGSDGDTFCTRACGEDLPASSRLERESGDLTNIIFVINNKNASHERIYSLMRRVCVEVSCWFRSGPGFYTVG